MSEDGLTWTVDIRDDVKFTDGEPLTREDVAFTYNTLRDTSSVNDFTMLEEAVAVERDTVEFHMSRPIFHLALHHGHCGGSCRSTPTGRITVRIPSVPAGIC